MGLGSGLGLGLGSGCSGLRLGQSSYLLRPPVFFSLVPALQASGAVDFDPDLDIDRVGQLLVAIDKKSLGAGPAKVRVRVRI